mgnify:CR=1 FL=1|tara:strand:+ start:1363 stop:2418 length:1056 start_codon:yes stop_codon:yes gene_type:complete
MQQIERYGVLALLLLVVTLVTVGLWGPDPTQASEPKNRAGADQRTAAAQERAARPNRRRAAETPPAGQRTAAQRQQAQRQQANAQGGPLPLNNVSGNQAARRELEQWEQQQRDHAPIASNLGQPNRRNDAPPAIRRDRQENSTQPGPADRGQANAGRQSQAQPVSNRPGGGNQNPAPKAGPKYKVQPGDSLERIASRQLGDWKRWEEIAQLNGVTNPNMIRVDQVLDLPAGAQAQPGEQPRSTPRARFVSNDVSGTRTYTVKSGDALSVIASRECGTKNRMGEILALNPGLKADKIYVGQKLKLPAGGAAVAQATPATASDRGPARAQGREDHRVAGLRAGLNQRGNSRVR